MSVFLPRLLENWYNLSVMLTSISNAWSHRLEPPWRRKWHPTPVLLPGKFHGWRSLVGYSSWGCKESDTTERLHFLSFYSSFWRRKWQPTPMFLPGESRGQRGLVGYSLWGCRESDTTKRLTYTHIGERGGEGEIHGESKMKLTLPYVN